MHQQSALLVGCCPPPPRPGGHEGGADIPGEADCLSDVSVSQDGCQSLAPHADGAARRCAFSIQLLSMLLYLTFMVIEIEGPLGLVIPFSQSSFQMTGRTPMGMGYRA